MSESTFTFGQVEGALLKLGFRVHEHRKGERRVYRHPETRALVVLPDFATEVRVSLPHLDAVMTTLENASIADRKRFTTLLEKAA